MSPLLSLVKGDVPKTQSKLFASPAIGTPHISQRHTGTIPMCLWAHYSAFSPLFPCPGLGVHTLDELLLKRHTSKCQYVYLQSTGSLCKTKIHSLKSHPKVKTTFEPWVQKTYKSHGPLRERNKRESKPGAWWWNTWLGGEGCQYGKDELLL